MGERAGLVDNALREYRCDDPGDEAVTARPADAWLNAIKRIDRFPSP
jgi:hypothetical protein